LLVVYKHNLIYPRTHAVKVSTLPKQRSFGLLSLWGCHGFCYSLGRVLGRT